ncbi:MAG: DUF4012 domain-containing protein [Candidatus Pacebacteria bacterium]|nr:DUF4012 domain-containing protein [Candidatus Paceibacterota bacterium]
MPKDIQLQDISNTMSDEKLDSQVENLFVKAAKKVQDEPEDNVVKTTKDSTEMSSKSNDSKSKKKFSLSNLFNSKGKKIGWAVFSIFLILFSIIAGVGFYTYQVAMELKTQGLEAKTTGMATYTNFKNQNLPGAEAELNKLKEQLATIRSTYSKLNFYRNVPIINNYYLDGEHSFNAAEAGLNAGGKTIEAIAPYADVLGFSGEGTFEGGSAENRIKLILDTLEKVTPILDEIQANLDTVSTELAQIDDNRYPEDFQGVAVRELIAQAKQGAGQANLLLSDYRPIIELIPDIAGSKGERRKYLVLFQNDNELRPTGGFLTAYSVIYIEDGKVTPEKSDDIYELDKKFNKRIPIPEELGRYLTSERYWNLRDMNTSPDFKTSMDQFFEYYKNIPGEPDNIDGIIAVDTQLLTDLIEVVGPINIPGYGTFSAEIDPKCDCPQIILALSEIITRPTPYLREDRKGILGPLMSTILTKLYSSPRTYMADLSNIALKDIEGRHIQMYFLNEEFQKSVEAINAAGRLEVNDNAQDSLAIVNANLGGAKSNLFVDYNVTQTVSDVVDGRITKTVEITYKNDHKADNCNLEAGLLCLNSTLRDWTRLYVPQGSELVEAQGFTEEAKVYDEAGFTVFDGFFTLEPMAQAKLKVTYTVPYTDETYKINLWKQGGINPIPMIMDVTGGQEEVLVNKDLIYETEF